MIEIVEIIIFLCISIAIGLINSTKNDEEGYMVAGRTLGVFRSVMTLCGTFVGAMTLLVYTAFVYTFGISALWIFVGYFIGFLGFIPFALYLKDYSEGKRFYTIADFFREKFGTRISLLVVSVIFIWYYGTLSAQLVGGGKVLQELTDIDYKLSVIIICIVIITYIVFGGFKSVVATDVFQFIAMGIILIVVTFTLSRKLVLPVSYLNPFNAGAVNIIAFLLLGLATPFATQDYWQKVYAMKNRKVVKRSFAISGAMLLVLSFFLTYVGLVARSSFPNIDPDMAFLYSMTKLTPVFLKGLIGIAFFAAILSTSDTFLFLLSVNITNDFITLKEKQLNKKIKYTRIAVVLIGLSSLGLALLLPKIVDLAIIFKSIGLVVSPVVLFIWSKKENPLAIVLSISLSAVIVIILALSGYTKPELVFVSMLLSALIYFIVFIVKKLIMGLNKQI
jgi:Na+/proline symporter